MDGDVAGRGAPASRASSRPQQECRERVGLGGSSRVTDPGSPSRHGRGCTGLQPSVGPTVGRGALVQGAVAGEPRGAWQRPEARAHTAADRSDRQERSEAEDRRAERTRRLNSWPDGGCGRATRAGVAANPRCDRVGSGNGMRGARFGCHGHLGSRRFRTAIPAVARQAKRPPHLDLRQRSQLPAVGRSLDTAPAAAPTT